MSSTKKIPGHRREMQPGRHGRGQLSELVTPCSSWIHGTDHWPRMLTSWESLVHMVQDKLTAQSWFQTLTCWRGCVYGKAAHIHTWTGLLNSLPSSKYIHVEPADFLLLCGVWNTAGSIAWATTKQRWRGSALKSDLYRHLNEPSAPGSRPSDPAYHFHIWNAARGHKLVSDGPEKGK